MTAKALIQKYLGEKNMGRLEYLLKPGARAGWGGPFNGQIHRQRIFLDLMARLSMKVIVETGTYRGTTTAFLGSLGLPVFSVEMNPHSYGFSQLRFLFNRRIHLDYGESGSFLRRLACNARFPKSKVFFYLDAHWREHLPLAEELAVIFKHWTESVVMVDDFQVPGTDYGYDDYGPGRALTLDYLEPFKDLGLARFFPAIDPSQETGAKRGCVVLCQDQQTASILAGIPGLHSEAKERKPSNLSLT